MIFVDDFNGTNDSDRIDAAISHAESESLRASCTRTVVFAERRYRVTRAITVMGGVSLASEGGGSDSTELQFHDIEDGQTLVKLVDGSRTGFRGFRITAAMNQSAACVTGLECQSLSSADLRKFQIRLDMLGDNSTGIRCSRLSRNAESNSFAHFEVRAAKPVVFNSGDNCSFRHWDMCCTNSVTGGDVSAIFQGGPATCPLHLHVGPGTGQRGDHAIYFRSIADRVGSGLFLSGFRWEQGTDHGQAAWVCDVQRIHATTGQLVHGLETFAMRDCRNSPRQHSTEIAGTVQTSIDDSNFLFGTPKTAA
jgi:hypothetical protein